MNVIFVVLATLGIGFLSGLRAFTPIALVAWVAIWGWVPLAGSPFWFFGTNTFAIITSLLALAELIGDKLPKTPPRTQIGPLGARIVTGACCGAALCVAAGQWWLVGTLPGAIGGLCGTFAGYRLRRLLVQRLRVPDFVVALVEDFVTIAGALFLLQRFFSTSV